MLLPSDFLVIWIPTVSGSLANDLLEPGNSKLTLAWFSRRRVLCRSGCRRQQAESERRKRRASGH
jgi:hypothetical protein